MELKTLVQGKDELDVDEVNEFIESCSDTRLVLVHCSVRDEKTSERYFKELINEVDTPFLGVKVDGTATQEGFVQDAFVYGVLSGDFEVEVFTEEINYDNLDETAENIAGRLQGWELCITYSANYLTDCMKLDYILRRVQEKNPKTQIAGGVSAPKPIVTTKQGISEEAIVYALIKGIETEFYMDSGFQLDENSDLEFQITKADELHIYEINNKPAVDEYCRIQHIRPYMLNKIMALTKKQNAMDMLKKILDINEVLYEACLRTGTLLLGAETRDKLVEPLFVFEVNKNNTQKSHIIIQTYKPKGTILKRGNTTKNKQLKVYDRLRKKHKKPKALIINSCVIRELWMNFDFKALEEKTKKILCPFMTSFLYGEYGTQIPYKRRETNLLNGGTIKALVFK